MTSCDSLADEDLMARVAHGDRTAYGMLVRRYAIRYRALAYRIIGDMAAAEDMVQDSFVKVWTHAGSFDAGKARFTTWFHRIVTNRCLDEKRRRRPESLPDGFDGVDGQPSAEDHMAAEDGDARVRIALGGLADRQRLAVTLSYFDGLSNQEAADVMDMNLKAYESLLVRARAKLRDELVSEKDQLLAT